MIRSLDSFVPDLYMFSHLQPNTFVHRDRAGGFIPTCSDYSTLFGVQTIANFFKGHKSTDLRDHLREFIQDLISSIDSTNNVHDMAMICNALKHAIRGSAVSGENGGMRGLLLTYADDVNMIHDDLKSYIVRLQNKVVFIEETIVYSKDCPEKHISAERWNQLMSIPLRKEPKGFYDYCMFSVSLGYNDMMRTFKQWDWWNKVLTCEKSNASLFLSALPLKQVFSDDIAPLRDTEKIAAVLSVTEVAENTTEGYFTSAVSPSDWKQHGIRHLQLPVRDFNTAPLDMVERGVEFIHMNMEEGLNILVHCKAGKARSALIVMCYLIRYRGYKASSAYFLVCDKRKQAGFKPESDKFVTLKQYEKKYKL